MILYRAALVTVLEAVLEVVLDAELVLPYMAVLETVLVAMFSLIPVLIFIVQ
jgi:hypothetical protein